MNGLVAVFLPRWIPGLEVGGGRFIHGSWPEEGVRREHLLQPFESLFKRQIQDADERRTTNQLASAFVRWAVPSAGVEVFGEFLREDHSYDARILMLEPDDLSGYTLGLQRVWWGGENHLVALRLELMNTETSHRHRGQWRDRGDRALPLYIHTGLPQGHTHRGRLLASERAFGGAAASIGLDRYISEGRWSLEWERVLLGERPSADVSPQATLGQLDVLHSLTLSHARLGGRVEWFGDLTASRSSDRNFEGPAFNLHLRVGAVAGL